MRGEREDLRHQRQDRRTGYLVTENVKLKKNPGPKHPGNLGHHEKTKYMSNKNSGRRIILGQKTEKYLEQNHSRKSICPYEEENYKSTKSMHKNK